MRYNVWSRSGTLWMVVDAGTKKQAEASAARKIESAQRLLPDGTWAFVVLPEGDVPEDTS